MGNIRKASTEICHKKYLFSERLNLELSLQPCKRFIFTNESDREEAFCIIQLSFNSKLSTLGLNYLRVFILVRFKIAMRLLVELKDCAYSCIDVQQISSYSVLHIQELKKNRYDLTQVLRINSGISLYY